MNVSHKPCSRAQTNCFPPPAGWGRGDPRPLAGHDSLQRDLQRSKLQNIEINETKPKRLIDI